MIVPATNGVDKAVTDIYGNPFYTALAQAVETLRHAPYWHEGEKAPSRLDRARELVRNSRVLLQDARLATVYGSTKLYDVTGFHCTCPQSQKGQSSWCVHSVAVKLARTLAEQGPREAAPVELGTLRPGTLPLPPVTVDERLAQRPAFNDEDLEARDMETHPTPQEARMADDAQYIPEPDDAPVATLERPTPEPAHVSAAVAAGQALVSHTEPPDTTAATPRPLPGPVLLPSLDAQSLKRSMQEWSAQRQVIRSFLQQELKEGVDFYRLQVRGKDANPTLSKAGAEKFLGLFQLQASFAPDLLTWEMLGKPTDHVIYICTLRTRSGEIVGEGRGSRSLKKDSGDTNKAIKMSEKSALIDAVLRTGALSEVYTQDVEDLQDEHAPASASPQLNSADLRKRIWAMVKAQAPHVTTRVAVEAWVHQETGYTLHADHYGDIVDALEVRA